MVPAELAINVIEVAVTPGGGNRRRDRIDETLNIQRLGFSTWRGLGGHYIPFGRFPNLAEIPAAFAMSASCHMAECCHRIPTATRFFQRQGASFHGDCCAGSSDLGMLKAELGNGKGSIIASARIPAPWVGRKTQGSSETSLAWDFCNTSWFAGPLAKDRLFASYEALLGFKTGGAAETKTRIAKKEKYNG
jgi:hypothetical protein